MHKPAEQLGDFAVGSIGPEARIASGEISEAKVEDLAYRLASDEFYDTIGELGPNAPGGTFCLVVADALTGGRFRQPGADAGRHAASLFNWLQQHRNTQAYRGIIPRVCIDGRLPVAGSSANKNVVGGHDDEHGPAGCGAQAKLESILVHMTEKQQQLRTFAANKCIEIDDETHRFIIDNARKLLTEQYVVPGEQIRQSFVDAAGKHSVTKLCGEHLEVVAALNTDPHKTLNRARVAAVFGPDYQVFGADIGTYQKAAAAIAESDQDTYRKFVAMLYYTEATSAVLPHSSLRLVVHEAD